MSGKLVGMVFDHYPVGGGELMLAVKLADNAHENGCHIYPSVGTLARQTRQSERTVQYQLKRMMARGWLVLVKHGSGGRGHAREYRIHPDYIAAHDSRTLPEQRPTWEFKQLDDDESVKGAKVAPFTEPQRVQPETQKGATAVARKGAIAVAPQPSLTVIEPNTPLPPTGGEAVGFTIEQLLAKLIEAHGRHSTSDTTAAHSALRRIAPDPASSERMLAALRTEVSANPQWQRDDGRFRPRLSKWLRGWRSLDATGVAQLQAQPTPDSQARERERAMVAQRLAEQQRVSQAPPSPPSAQERERIRQLVQQAKAAASVGVKVKKRG